MAESKKENKGCLIALGIIVALIWLVINPISFVVVFIFGLAVFLTFKYSRKKHEEQKIKNFENKKDIVVADTSYIFIENFVKKYKHNYSNEELKNLKYLLENKNIKIGEEELIWILRKEIEKQNYEFFKEKIHTCSPKKVEEYINTFLEIFGEDNQKYTPLLERLLKEDEIQFDGNDLSVKISKIAKKMEIDRFEKKIIDGNSQKVIFVNNLDLITGYEFEYFLKELFEKMGYKVENTSLSNDQGADLIVIKFGDKISVQAKRYSGSVGNKAIQEVVASIKHYKADRGVVITTSSFTRQAVVLAESNNIELIDRKGLESLIEKYY